MDSFDYEIRSIQSTIDGSNKLLEVAPRLKASLIRHKLPLPDSVSLNWWSNEIVLRYTRSDINYREVSWLYRIYFHTNTSHFVNNDVSKTQSIITSGSFPRYLPNGTNVRVIIDIGLRETCEVIYVESTITKAKIVCKQKLEDIVGTGVVSSLREVNES